MGSKLFQGYKAVGFVSGPVRSHLRYVKGLNELRIITCVGRCFNSYNQRLQLVETSHPHDDEISCIDSDSIYVFTASKNIIYCWKHGHKWLIRTYDGHQFDIKCLLVFGAHVISIDTSNLMLIHVNSTGKLFLSLQLPIETFDVTCINHPSTYTNKILLGSKQGTLKLMNIRTQKTIYEFAGWNSPVTTIEQAPVIDVVAIGLANGIIVVHNLKKDETIIKFRQEWGAVRSISFRSDGPPYMVSSGNTGNIAIWDLEKEKLCTQMRDVHDGTVFCNFLLNEPLMVTNSNDNSLKVWIFNEFDRAGRLHHERSGHRLEPTKISFFGKFDHQILSSSLDSSLRCFSTFSQRLDRNFGRLVYNKKLAKKVGKKEESIQLPHITNFAVEANRAQEWENLVAIHSNYPLATTWSTDKVTMGSHKLQPERLKGKKMLRVTSVTITNCGNFAVIGYSSGDVDRFNLQSGIHRKQYGDPAHKDSVTGLFVDSVNQVLVTVSLDGYLRLWRFTEGKFMAANNLKSPITKLVGHKENNVVAVALENTIIHVIDVIAKSIIRTFTCRAKIIDMVFTHDFKWLIVATDDKCIRVFDLIKSCLIDIFELKNQCTSIDVSSNGEFFATAIAGDPGIYIWANVTLFMPVSLRPIGPDYVPSRLDLPTIKTDIEDSDEIPEDVNEEDEEDFVKLDEDATKMDIDEYTSPEQLAENLITLSNQPISKWKNLLNIDLIKSRNKPKDPPKITESAPFFLPTVAGLEPEFDITSKTKDENGEIDTKVLNRLRGLSSFGQLLLECEENNSYKELWSSLKEMSPSAIDVEIRSLDFPLIKSSDNLINDFEMMDYNDGKSHLLVYFLRAIRNGLKTGKDYELMVSYLALFLKIHAEVLFKNSEAREECQLIASSLKDSWSMLETKFNMSLCIINYLRSSI